MGLFSRRQEPEQLQPMNAPMSFESPPAPDSQYQHLDPMAAVQMSRQMDADPYGAVGVANITVDNHHVIEEFKARLKGTVVRRRVNYDTGEELSPEIVKYGEPVMNEEGINHLCGILESVLGKNIMLSHIPKEDHKHVVKMTQVFGRTIAAQIAINSERWKVDRSRRDSLPLEICIFLYTNLMRAFDDGERRKLYPGQKHMTTTMINPAQMQPEKRTMIGF